MNDIENSLPKACCTPAKPALMQLVAPAAPLQQHIAASPLTPRAPDEIYGSRAGMKRLEGGEFSMGTDGPLAWPGDGEGPVRAVRVAPFRLDVCAVSNAQFAVFVDATGFVTEAEKFGWSYVFYKFISAQAREAARGAAADTQWWLGVEGAHWKRPEGPKSNLKGRADHPVVHISWHDAFAYCAWAGKRLPHEAEWEYAARGGLAGKIYPWGDELTPKGKNGKPQHHCNIWQGKFPTFNSGADGYLGTAPSKSFAPNGFGFYNMAGNVWEWCADWFSPAHPSGDGLENPTGPPTGTQKVIRGGSYLCHASYCTRYRVAARTSNTPDSTTGHCGFRCAMDA